MPSATINPTHTSVSPVKCCRRPAGRPGRHRRHRRGVLTAPGAHTGQVYSLTAPQSLTLQEIAAIMSDVTGRKATYRARARRRRARQYLLVAVRFGTPSATGEVDLGRGVSVAAGPFPQAASRTRRAPQSAPGSPQAPQGGWCSSRGAWPWRWDACSPVVVTSSPYSCRVEQRHIAIGGPDAVASA